MYNKNIALIAALLFCVPSFAIMNDADDHHHHAENNKQKLALLEKIMKSRRKENKLLLNENHWSNKQICFWLTLASAGVAAASFFVKESGKVAGAAAIVGVTAAGAGTMAGYSQHCALHNITEEKKALIKAINDAR